MEGLGQEILAFLEGFKATHAVVIGGVVMSIILGHGIGRALGDLVIAIGQSIKAKFSGGSNSSG